LPLGIISLCPCASTDFQLRGRLELPSKGSNSQKGNPYPDSARRKNHEGRTVTAYIVERNGNVVDAANLESRGYDDLDQAAIDTVKHLHFERPGMLDGNAVRVILYIPLLWRTPKPLAMNSVLHSADQSSHP
jgi:TonB family protein